MKNISQIGSFPQVGVNIKNIWNHHLENISSYILHIQELPWYVLIIVWRHFQAT